MLNQLHLKGNALQVFAIIHGFSHAEGNEFAGSLQYLCEFTGASRSTVMRSLTELQNMGLIEKREIYENGVKFNRYRTNENLSFSVDTTGIKMIHPPCQNDTTPGIKMTPPPRVKMTPNIIEENNIGDNIGNKYSKREPTPDELAERFQSSELAEAVTDWLEYKKERREGYKPTGLKSLLSQIEKQADAHGAHAVADTIRLSMSNGWRGIIWDRMQTQKQTSSNPFWEMLREEESREQSGHDADYGDY